MQSEKLQCFDFNEAPVRVLEKGGQPWFVAADVCRALEIGNSRDAVSRLDDDEKATVGNADSRPGQPGAKSFQIISESGLYALVFKSNKPEAKKFRKWVTGEVLPAIRQKGAYEVVRLSEVRKAKVEELANSAHKAGEMTSWVGTMVQLRGFSVERARAVTACAGRTMEAIRLEMEILGLGGPAPEKNEADEVERAQYELWKLRDESGEEVVGAKGKGGKGI